MHVKHRKMKTMKKHILLALTAILLSSGAMAQLNAAITSWLQNTTVTGTYYTSGNSTAVTNGTLVNCQQVEYSTDYVYVTTTGVPAFATGPFLDGNPSQATDQNQIFQIPRNPVPSSGAPSATTGGTIGVFVNGVSLFDYRDGVAWNTATNALCGGPGNPPCPGGPMATMPWNRDAIPAEMGGFDCSKGHPAMGTYHHHQNPSAFKLDQNVVSTICNMYDADGLYAINSSQHSPLLGYAYDGYPIYGAYGYANEDGTGGVTRIKSGYALRNITVRTHWADGTDVDDGPPVDATYFLGYFREDYEYVGGATEDFLDEHNGRICVTPEYPNETYAYFCTVDANWNSEYPYAVGPTFYGEYANRSVNSVNETTTVYTGATQLSETEFEQLDITVFPNPASDLIAVQINGLVKENMTVELLDITGKLVQQSNINAGQTIAHFDVETVYAGTYLVRIRSSQASATHKIVINR